MNIRIKCKNKFTEPLLIKARFSVFRHRCSNAKSAIESFLYFMRIIKSSEYINKSTPELWLKLEMDMCVVY